VQVLRIMTKTFKTYLPEQDLLLPPSLREWLPDDHLAYFVSDVVDQLDLSAIESVYEKEDRGQPPYHPSMMTKVLKCSALHFRINAASIVMRALVPESPRFRYFERFSLRIKERVVREAINLSLARNRPDLSFGGVIASSVSSFMDGSARV
jgi:hypothetical protein